MVGEDDLVRTDPKAEQFMLNYMQQWIACSYDGKTETMFYVLVPFNRNPSQPAGEDLI